MHIILDFIVVFRSTIWSNQILQHWYFVYLF